MLALWRKQNGFEEKEVKPAENNVLDEENILTTWSAK